MVKTFQKCNPPDLKIYFGKLNKKKIPHMVQCYFCVCIHCINQYTNQYKKAKKI